MKKIIKDLLVTRGKWSFKRVTGIFTLLISILYAFIPSLLIVFEVKEFVFLGFLSYSATMMGMTLWQKKNVDQENNKTKEEHENEDM